MDTTRLKAILGALLISQAAVLHAQTGSLPAIEDELYRSMRALSSTLRGGITHQDYTARIREVTLLYERYERSGGSNAELRDVHRALLDAKLAFDRLVELRNRRPAQAMSNPEARAAELAREKAEEQALQRSWHAALRRLAGPEPVSDQAGEPPTAAGPAR